MTKKTVKTSDNLFLVGPMGAGKTSVGRTLAEELDRQFYDSDQEIEKRMGVPLTWIYDLEGMVGMRNRETKILDDLTSMHNVVISTGGDCVEVPLIRQYLSERGLVVYMEVSLETQLKRLKRDRRRPLLQGEDPQAVLIKLWEEREPYYENLADFTVMTDHRSVREVCDQILGWLRG